MWAWCGGMLRSFNPSRRTVGRHVGAPNINASVKPLASFELIGFRIPSNELHPLRKIMPIGAFLARNTWSWQLGSVRFFTGLLQNLAYKFDQLSVHKSGANLGHC